MNNSESSISKELDYRAEKIEYQVNLNLMRDLNDLKSKINALISIINECSSNITTTYRATKEAVIEESISISIEKINDYNKDIEKVEEYLETAKKEIENKVNSLSSRNNYLYRLINV